MSNYPRGSLFLPTLLPVFLAVVTSTAEFVAPPTSVTLTWDANIEANLAGYIVAWGTASRSYPFSRAVSARPGEVKQVTIDGLTPKTDYYFAVVAYGTGVNQTSDFSNEVIYSVPDLTKFPAPIEQVDVVGSETAEIVGEKPL
jgi:hypothetical protein